MSKHSQQRRLFLAFILVLVSNAGISYLTHGFLNNVEHTANMAEKKTDKLIPVVHTNTRLIKQYITSKPGATGATGATGGKGQRGKTVRGPRGRKGDKGDKGESGTKIIEVRRVIVIQRVGPPGPKGEKGDPGITKTVPKKCDPLLGYFCADPDDPYNGLP